MGFDIGATLYILLLIISVDTTFTIAFVLPLFRARFEHARTLAIRSVIATVLSLVGVIGDFGYLQSIGGQVRAWTMWLAVVGDLTFNATVVFVISNYKMRDEMTPSGPSGAFQVSSSPPSVPRGLYGYGVDTVGLHSLQMRLPETNGERGVFGFDRALAMGPDWKNGGPERNEGRGRAGDLNSEEKGW